MFRSLFSSAISDLFSIQLAFVGRNRNTFSLSHTHAHKHTNARTSLSALLLRNRQRRAHLCVDHVLINLLFDFLLAVNLCPLDVANEMFEIFLRTKMRDFFLRGISLPTLEMSD